MFIAALLTIAKTCKQSNCPLINDWIRKMWYIQTMEYYSAIKKNEIMPFAARWMHLEIIILSEVSQTVEDIYGIIYMWKVKKNDINELMYKTEIDPQT